MTPQEITEYLFLEDKDPRGDLVFVFGAANAVHPCIAKAFDLFQNNAAPMFIVTGGMNEKHGFVEADKISDELEKLGMPAEMIIREGNSTNSLENVLNAIPDIDKKIGWKNIQTIVVVTKDYHIRRAMMTLRKHIPAHVQLKAAPYTSPEYGITKEGWNESERSRERVLSEIERIETYLAKGDIAEL